MSPGRSAFTRKFSAGGSPGRKGCRSNIGASRPTVRAAAFWGGPLKRPRLNPAPTRTSVRWRSAISMPSPARSSLMAAKSRCRNLRFRASAGKATLSTPKATPSDYSSRIPARNNRRFMRRRSFLAIAAVVAPRWARAQQLNQPVRQLAAVVLPASLGAARIDKIAADFIVWIRDYKPGAEISSGYGNPRTQVMPASPAADYLEQLTALGSPISRDAVEKALADAKVERIPQRPNGRHVASDLLAFFFSSADGEDFLYNAAIKRDDCRGLADSIKRPARLT